MSYGLCWCCTSSWLPTKLHAKPCCLLIEVFDDLDKVCADVVLLHVCPQSCMPNPAVYVTVNCQLRDHNGSISCTQQTWSRIALHKLTKKLHLNTAKPQFQKTQKKDKPKYFFLISNESAHSIKICLTVITALHATQTEASSFLKIKECVKKEWPICNLFKTMFSFLVFTKR